MSFVGEQIYVNSPSHFSQVPEEERTQEESGSATPPERPRDTAASEEESQVALEGRDQTIPDPKEVCEVNRHSGIE